MALESIQSRLATAAASLSGKLTARLSLRAGQASARAILAAQIDATDDRLLAPALALLPPGRAFDADEGSLLRTVCDALSRTFSRLFRLADDARQSLIPGRAGALVAIWAQSLALQDGENAAQRLAEGTFTLDELQRRLFDVWRDCGVENLSLIFQISPRDPFRVGLSRVGEPLRGDEWRFRFDVTILVPLDHTNDAQELCDAFSRAQGRPAFEAWLLRAFPPWCALCLVIQDQGSEGSHELLRLNLTRRN